MSFITNAIGIGYKKKRSWLSLGRFRPHVACRVTNSIIGMSRVITRTILMSDVLKVANVDSEKYTCGLFYDLRNACVEVNGLDPSGWASSERRVGGACLMLVGGETQRVSGWAG